MKYDRKINIRKQVIGENALYLFIWLSVFLVPFMSAGLMSEEIMAENLKSLNEQVAAYERLVRIIIYPNEFEKTPKRSIKRYLYDISKLV
jgi:hypothetical protein